MRSRLGFLIMAGLIGGLVAAGFMYFVAPFCQSWCDVTHLGILNGTAGAPFRYRVLAAHIAGAMPGETALQYVLAHWIAAPTVFVLLWIWLRDAVGERMALIGCYLVAAAMLVMFFQYVIALYSIIEIGLLALGLILLRVQSQQRYMDIVQAGIFVVLVGIGTLNRETTGFLLVLAALAAKRFRTFVMAGVVFAAVFVALRLILGTVSENLADIFQRNLVSVRLFSAGINHLVLLPLAMLTVAGWKLAPQAERRRLIIIGAPYMVLTAAFGLWDEVRLWMPALMLALPIILRWVSQPERPTSN